MFDIIAVTPCAVRADFRISHYTVVSRSVEVFAAPYRQEDRFRDHKQRLGMEECRAWTKAPILRTCRVQMGAQTMLRLSKFQLDVDCGPASPSDWNRKKKHPSILDLRRLLWRQREHSSHFLVELQELPKVEPELGTVLAMASGTSHRQQLPRRQKGSLSVTGRTHACDHHRRNEPEDHCDYHVPNSPWRP
jgi:hypothetical protein